MRTVILDLLPRQNGENKRVDWDKSVGGYIPFVYDTIQGVLKVIEVERVSASRKRILVEYNGEQTWVFPASLRRAELKQVVKVSPIRRTPKPKPSEFRKGQSLLDENRNLLLLKEGYKTTGKTKVRGFTYQCQCCGHKGFKPLQQLRKGSGCANWSCRNKVAN